MSSSVSQCLLSRALFMLPDWDVSQVVVCSLTKRHRLCPSRGGLFGGELVIENMVSICNSMEKKKMRVDKSYNMWLFFRYCYMSVKELENSLNV